ncbi:MAG: MerR family transcriptional regulator [Oscillospiraceae bacterium]|nr:MerR family transcriptional regulator [Oscillospiraceae bacterium]
MSISKFASFTGMSRSSVIFYDEHGLFFPKSRGENGYRYYSPMQIVTVNFVNTLRSLDVPVKKIRELAHERTPEELVELLIEQDDILGSEIDRLTEAKKVISTMLGNIQNGFNINEDEISVRFMPSTRIILGEENRFTKDGAFYKPYLEYCARAKERGQNLNYPIGGYFDSMDASIENPRKPARFFSLDPDGHDKKSAGRYLVGYCRCYYGEPGDIAARMLAYAREQELPLTGPVYQLYLFDEISLNKSDHYLLQTCVRIAEPPAAQSGHGSKRASNTMRAPRNS